MATTANAAADAPDQQEEKISVEEATMEHLCALLRNKGQGQAAAHWEAQGEAVTVRDPVSVFYPPCARCPSRRIGPRARRVTQVAGTQPDPLSA